MVRMVRKSWYNMKMCPKKKKIFGREIERKFKKYNTKRKNSRFLIILFWLGRGWFLYLVRVTILPKHPRPFNFSKFRLALSPTLYKFIVWTYWAWVQSCFGVQAKIGPYNWRYLWEKLDLIRRRFRFSAENGKVRFAPIDDRATSGWC